MFNHLDYYAFALSTIGTLIWAHNSSKWAKWAAPIWLVSSILWVIYGYITAQPALALRDLIATCIDIYACWRWLGPSITIKVKAYFKKT